MTTQTRIDENFLKNELDRIQKEKEENSRFVQLKNGENIIKIDLSMRPIEDKKGKYGTKMVFQTLNEKNGKKLLLSTSPTLYGFVIKALSSGYNPFTLIKLGEGKDTRYAIKELETQ